MMRPGWSARFFFLMAALCLLPSACGSRKVAVSPSREFEQKGDEAYFSQDLEAAIDNVMVGKKVVPVGRLATKDTTPLMGSFNPLKRLTFQQARVLHHVCRGLLNKQIAFELGVGETTVKAHMREIFRKLGVASRTQALVRIMRLEPVQTDDDHAIQQAT